MDWRDNNGRGNIWIIRTLEKREWTENVFKEIWSENTEKQQRHRVRRLCKLRIVRRIIPKTFTPRNSVLNF